MAIHRFKCSGSLNKEIVQFADVHKFDSKENLIEQFESWTKEIIISELIEKEKEFLQDNSYEGNIHMKIFKSIKYYYIKKFLEDEVKEKVKKRKPTYFPKEFLTLIYTDIEHNFEINRSFKPSETYIVFLKQNNIEDSESIKKCYKNIYYQIKNKKYYVNDK